MSNDVVLESLTGRVLTITLNRPDRRNTVTMELVHRLHDAVSRAATNDQAGAVVLTGAGNHFCAGGDVGTMAATQQVEKSEATASLELGSEIPLILHRMAKPTIAMINGVAAGGGLALAAACDFRLCSVNARLTFAYTKIGLSGDFGATYFLSQLLGKAKARAFCMLSPIVDAEEALQLGLAHRVFPAETLAAETYAFADQLANGPTGALGLLKKNLNAALELEMETAVQLEAQSFLFCRETEDHLEAARAFMEKRVPVFNSGSH